MGIDSMNRSIIRVFRLFTHLNYRTTDVFSLMESGFPHNQNKSKAEIFASVTLEPLPFFHQLPFLNYNF